MRGRLQRRLLLLAGLVLGLLVVGWWLTHSAPAHALDGRVPGSGGDRGAAVSGGDVNVAARSAVDAAMTAAGLPQEQQRPLSGIPRIIHQTWKTRDLPDESGPLSWKRLNPSYEYRFYTDAEIAAWVHERHPELVSAFERMLPIERADLFRYVILHDVGGVYADIDVACSQPVDDWFKISGNLFNVNAVIGFEIVTGKRKDWHKWFARKHQFCQWTMASAPGTAVFAEVLSLIGNVFATNNDTELRRRGVMENTGPAIWSDAIAAVVKRDYNLTFGEEPLVNARVENFFMHVGDMLFLPLRSFGLGSAGYVLKHGEREDEVFVRHHFMGTWKAKRKQQEQQQQQQQQQHRAVPDNNQFNAVPLRGNSFADCGPLPAAGGEVCSSCEAALGAEAWRAFAAEASGWRCADDMDDSAVVLTFASPDAQAFQLTSYVLTAGLGKIPSAWTVECQQNGAGLGKPWVPVDRQDGVYFTNRGQTRTFVPKTLLEPAAGGTVESILCAVYRFNFTAASAHAGARGGVTHDDAVEDDGEEEEGEKDGKGKEHAKGEDSKGGSRLLGDQKNAMGADANTSKPLEEKKKQQQQHSSVGGMGLQLIELRTVPLPLRYQPVCVTIPSDSLDSKHAIQQQQQQKPDTASPSLPPGTRVCVCCSESGRNESVASLIDGQAATKMLLKWTPLPAAPVPLQPIINISLPSTQCLKGYALVSANDFEQRDPATWLVRGLPGPGSSEWVTLDGVTDIRFAGRFEERVFHFDKIFCVQQLSLAFVAMRNESDMRCSTPRCMQLGELRLLLE